MPMKKLFAASAPLAVGFSTARPAQSQEVSKQPSDDDDIPDAGLVLSPLHTKQIKSDQEVSDSKGPGADADVGILSREKPDRSSTKSYGLHPLAASTSSCPAKDVVMCINGKSLLPSGDVMSCQAMCGGKCCDGTQACDLFTGVVCKDSISCFGDKSCYNATISMVLRGCHGEHSCSYANIHRVIEGCDGGYACYSAGYDGSIGTVYKSCIGDEACSYAAQYGNIAAMQESCIGKHACTYAAAEGGTIGIILDSCLGERACYAAAYYYGNITGEIQSSCHGANLTCYYAASYGGSIGNILKSCHQERACAMAAACTNATLECGSNITIISNSCDGKDACNNTAYGGSFIGGIRNACNNIRACVGTANNGNNITSGINDCCSAGPSACANITTVDFLPVECSIVPSSAHIKTPVADVDTTLGPTTPSTIIKLTLLFALIFLVLKLRRGSKNQRSKGE
mmetsp:Transcript_37253/g.78559  ORF Transcript_37253/g.78559 Transcript_37253/m.78559 type:complete len:456 (-) Transcript_37253:460-1827(-)|eukprot:CAMPEP_0183747846 /NCGR_PEP_ID=MMETSP0737-20130205/67472_1 /TAXON_ID=385413 /ORGANISM="Thalassiosira miniscula, Strain CCMP1093" /LENGTH=455 /DNA_ID=CAMNT_0025983563 /DNA_START=137 /DNA_END=1504 /DNA_ORIENTATION=-